jgi:hypothetical protein
MSDQNLNHYYKYEISSEEEIFQRVKCQIKDLSKHLEIYLKIKEGTIRSIINNKNYQQNSNKQTFVKTWSDNLTKYYLNCLEYFEDMEIKRDDLKLKILILK